MAIGGLIGLLIWVIVVGAVLYLLRLFLAWAAIPEPISSAVWIICCVIALISLILKVAPLLAAAPLLGVG